MHSHVHTYTHSKVHYITCTHACTHTCTFAHLHTHTCTHAYKVTDVLKDSPATNFIILHHWFPILFLDNTQHTPWVTVRVNGKSEIFFNFHFPSMDQSNFPPGCSELHAEHEASLESLQWRWFYPRLGTLTVPACQLVKSEITTGWIQRFLEVSEMMW